MHLPQTLIANKPAKPRDHSRLMRLDRLTGRISHHHFYDLPSLLRPTDVLVFNDTKVLPSRLFGHKDSGGKIELLLLKQLTPTTWTAIAKPKPHLHQQLTFAKSITTQTISINSDDTITLVFNHLTLQQLAAIGHTPLPPYIHSPLSPSTIRSAYQTVYAKTVGSAAAPTAGLHFTHHLLHHLNQIGIQTESVTLHVGLGTFKPLQPANLRSGRLHSESYTLDSPTAQRLNLAKSEGRRIIAVGTTTTRVLETCSNSAGHLIPQTADTDIFIRPPYHFKFIDGLITNFHLPQSSLILLVSAFVKQPEFITTAYQLAINQKYRFYSFGDAMLID